MEIIIVIIAILVSIIICMVMDFIIDPILRKRSETNQNAAVNKDKNDNEKYR